MNRLEAHKRLAQEVQEALRRIPKHCFCPDQAPDEWATYLAKVSEYQTNAVCALDEILKEKGLSD